MDYLPPKHNLTVFNPNEFPLISNSVADLTTLNTILDETVSNDKIIASNTVLINNFNKVFSSSIATTTGLRFTNPYTIALPTGSTPPNTIPFMLIVNIPITCWTNGVSINTIVVTLNNSNSGQVITNRWTQSPNDSTLDILQKTMNPQFILTGIGNGYTWALKVTVTGAKISNTVYTDYAINANTYPDINALQMVWL